MNKLIQACALEGLDLDTGISSGIISVERLEQRTGKRLVGNGSTLRRDNTPWSFFRFHNVKEGSSVVGYKFNGYKTGGDMIEELEDQNRTSNKRMEKEARKIEDRGRDIQRLRERGSLDATLYGRESL